VCKGQCFDFEIRVYCECDDDTARNIHGITKIPSPLQKTTPKDTTVPVPTVPIVPVIQATTPKYEIPKDCDPNKPNVEHPTDCSKFLQCERNMNGKYMYMEKPCSPGTIFNPKTMICDWPKSVIAIKPSCGKSEQMQGDRCPPTHQWSECAIPCKRACNYYGRQLALSGNCTTTSNECLPGCLPKDAAFTCEQPKLWRDWKSCVDINACTCMGPNNEILAPGQYIQTSPHKKCQCIKNELICVEVVVTITPKPTQWPAIVSTTTQRSLQIITEEEREIPPYIKECSPVPPHIEHPNSCYKFLHCHPGPDGNFVYAVKTCYPNTMYNPETMICDWPSEVQKVKPKCATDPGEIEIWEETVIERNKTRKTTQKSQLFSTAPTLLQTVSHHLEQGVDIHRTTPKTTARTTPKVRKTLPPDESGEIEFAHEKPPLYIRECDPTTPKIEHPNSCYKYLECTRMPDGTYKYEERTCYPDKMYNPVTKNCDFVFDVLQVKPVCNDKPGEIDFWQEIEKRKKSTPKPPILSQTNNVPAYIKECPPSPPHVEHPNSCYKFLHCMPAINGKYVYSVKTCYPDMMYNPTIMNCDHIANVERIKPICKGNPGEIEIWEDKVTTTTQSPRGQLGPQGQQGPQGQYGPPGQFGPQMQNKPSGQHGPQGQIGWPQTTPSSIPPLLKPDFRVEKVCDINKPIIEDKDNCYDYSECVTLPDGKLSLMKKTCGPSMMFDPVIKQCNWREDVALHKPQCSLAPTTPASITPPAHTGIVTARTKPPKVSPQPKLTTPIIVIPSTVTPPMQCDDSKFVHLLPLLPDDAITSSSILGEPFKSSNARLETTPKAGSIGHWSPATNDLNQYLQFNLPHITPVYGIIVKGSPVLNQYVTSYKVLYSMDGNVFHIIPDRMGNPQIFSGSVDQKTQVQSVFLVPIEAKIVRIYPLTWSGSIALKAEILGCQKDPLEPITFPTTKRLVVPTQAVPIVQGSTTPGIFVHVPIKPLCEDPLGVENGKLSPNQVKFSSIKDTGSVKTKIKKNPLDIIKLSSNRGWIPLTDNANEFITVS
jgi:F5/8 type C domain/Chitin binding Peritrophin-A domain